MTAGQQNGTFDLEETGGVSVRDEGVRCVALGVGRLVNPIRGTAETRVIHLPQIHIPQPESLDSAGFLMALNRPFVRGWFCDV